MDQGLFRVFSIFGLGYDGHNICMDIAAVMWRASIVSRRLSKRSQNHPTRDIPRVRRIHGGKDSLDVGLTWLGGDVDIPLLGLMSLCDSDKSAYKNCVPISRHTCTYAEMFHGTAAIRPEDHLRPAR